MPSKLDQLMPSQVVSTQQYHTTSPYWTPYWSVLKDTAVGNNNSHLWFTFRISGYSLNHIKNFEAFHDLQYIEYIL